MEFRDEMTRIRAALDAADSALMSALEARARAVRQFIELREREPEGYHTLPSASEVHARALELRREFPEVGLAPVIREIVGVCAEMVGPVRVAVPGPECGASHLAARRQFGTRARIRVLPSVGEAFAETERTSGGFAVVPFESSSEGAHAATLIGLTETKLKVVGEISIVAHLHLWSSRSETEVEKIYGSASALEAAQRTLTREYPRAALIDVRSSVVAASQARQERGAVALGTDLLGELTSPTQGSDDEDELRIVRAQVEDDPDQVTRFVVLGAQQPKRTGQDRTMLLLTLGDEPGALYGALAPFAERGINLVRLESRSTRPGGARDLFYVELDGHVSDRAVISSIEEVRLRTKSLKVLGSYARPSSGAGE